VRHLLGYVAIIGFGLVAVALVLSAGRGIDRAPTVPDRLTVSGPGSTCLGTELVARQSGIYLDLHQPGRGGTDENPAAGDRIGGGQVDRATGRAGMEGTCAAGTPLAARRFALALDADDLEHRPFDAEVEVGGRRIAAVLEAAPPTVNAAGEKPLQGTELTGRTFLAAAVVILLARAMGSLFSRLGQPRVVGEILAGIALGPSVIGALAPGITGFLFPAEVVQVVGALAQFGVIFFMFLVGLELDLGALRGSGRAAVMVSHVSIVAPFVLGVLASFLLFPLLGDGEFASFALFIGAAMSITAFPVLARILTDTGLDRTPLGTVAVTCAAVDDVTAWCVLSVVIAITQASGPAGVVRTAALLLVYVAVLFSFVRPALAVALRRWSELPEGRARDAFANQAVACLVALMLVGAWLTEEIGVHAIFGAFLVGVVVPRREQVALAVTDRLRDVTRLVLLPLFFVATGLSTRVGLLDSPLLWAVAVCVIGLAIAGKWGGSTLAARLCGMPWRDAAALGVLMNARGLTEIVILTIGLDLGIISPVLFTVMVLMALATTVMTVPVLRWLKVVPSFPGDDDQAQPNTGDEEVQKDEAVLATAS
jgi:Kef-type K+ transport system membrane component KefB